MNTMNIPALMGGSGQQPLQDQQQLVQQASHSSVTVPTIKVTATTWARDSHDLFDYEARHANTKNFTSSSALKVVRCGTEVQVIAESESPPAQTDYLLRVAQRNGEFTLFPAEKGTSSNSTPKRLWMVVRDLATRGHTLNESDIIKLGRFKLRVRQVIASAVDELQAELRLDESELLVVEPEQEDLATKTCRICLLEGPADDDPLITPCSCKGSIRYVHLSCLRTWIKGRLNLQDNPKGSYFYKQLSCELCKASYPAMVQMARTNDGEAGVERYPLVPVPKTQPPFIVLENMVRDSQVHSHRGLHVISLAENKLLKLGRGHESDVRIADVSISRCHATIRYHKPPGAEKGVFVLEDHCSKFGTLVAIKKPRPIEVAQPLSVQVGRSVLSFQLDQPESQSMQGDSAGAPNMVAGGSPRARRSLSATISAFTGPPRGPGPREEGF